MKPMLAAMAAEILPVFLQFIAVLLSAILGRAAMVASQRWGIEIEARHREALHSALMTGIRSALMYGLTGSAAVEEAIKYAQKSVPDALARLAPSPSVLADLTGAKLREALPSIDFTSAVTGFDAAPPLNRR